MKKIIVLASVLGVIGFGTAFFFQNEDCCTKQCDLKQTENCCVEQASCCSGGNSCCSI